VIVRISGEFAETIFDGVIREPVVEAAAIIGLVPPVMLIA
jgi:hypothetical protein